MAAHVSLGRPLGLAVPDEAHVRRGAAHVQRDEALAALVGGGPDDARGRARQHRCHGVVAGGRRAGGAAVGLHHLGRREAHGVGAVGEAVEVGPDQRRDGGVGGRRRGALVLAELAQHLVRDRHRAVQFLAEDGRGPPFVLGVGVGVEEGDGHALGVASPYLGSDIAHRGLVDGRLDTLGGRPFGHLVATLGRDQRRGPGRARVVQFGAGLPADVEDVREPLGRHERGGSACTLQQRVDGDGRRVAEAVDGARLDSGAVAGGPDPADDPLGGPVGGRDLRRREGAVRDEDHVGEGAPHVDAQRDAVHVGPWARTLITAGARPGPVDVCPLWGVVSRKGNFRAPRRGGRWETP